MSQVLPNCEKWVQYGLELSWYRTEAGSCDGIPWSESRGFVWGSDSTFCAASVRVRDGEYFIGELGLHGLRDDERKSLENHLESQKFTKPKPQEGLGRIICLRARG